MKRVVVIGAGAAGLMAAITAQENGAEVTLIEHNEKVGKKIYITGKGRCNLTNACPVEDFFQNVPTNPKFLYSSIHAFDSKEVCRFFEDAGLKLKVERGNRVFPVSDKSSDVIKTLQKECERKGVKVLLHTEVEEILPKGKASEATGKKDGTEDISADAVIIATGGLSYPSTGSDGDGYRFAESLGHKVNRQSPSLVPILLKEAYTAQLEGLSLRNVSVKIAKDAGSKPIFEDFGEMLFTAQGVSGPVILTASGLVGRQIEEGGYKLIIDLKPALEAKQLDQRILRDFEDAKNKVFKNSLNKLLPAKMVPVIIALSGIEPEERVNQINKAQRMQLNRCIKQLTFSIKGLGGFDSAVITKGGVDVKSIDPKTMESRLAPHIYFAGEVIDVDALTGGFNLQIAFATGRAAGLAASKEDYETDSDRWTCRCRKKHNCKGTFKKTESDVR